MSNDTALIFGATGFLGSAAAHSLLSRGWRVGALARRESIPGRLADVAGDVQWFDIADHDAGAAFRALGDVSAVLLTGAAFGRAGETAVHMLHVNTVLPFRLLNAALLAGTPVVINADTALRRYPSAYSLSKRHLAEWGSLLSEESDLRFINTRLEHLYGPGDSEDKFPAWVIGACTRGEPVMRLTAGEQRRDFVYIDDVANAYGTLLAASQDLSPGFHEFSIGTGVATRIRDFVDLVRNMTDASTQADFGALPYRRNEIMDSRADTRAMRDLGWQASTDLARGLRQTLERIGGI
jgi:CDP-paratose synthetase